MLNDKRGPIGKMLQGIKPEYREASFMGGQLGASRRRGPWTTSR